MQSLLLLGLMSILPLSWAAAGQCQCTYQGFVGDKCTGNTPSVSVEFPSMSEGTCYTFTIENFDTTWFDLNGTTYEINPNSTYITNLTNITNLVNLTNSTSGNSTSGSIVDFLSWTIDSCKGNTISYTFYAGTSCSSDAPYLQIDLTRGGCNDLLVVDDLTWLSYKVKCNRGGDHEASSGMKLSFSWLPFIASLGFLFFYTK